MFILRRKGNVQTRKGRPITRLHGEAALINPGVWCYNNVKEHPASKTRSSVKYDITSYTVTMAIQSHIRVY